MKFLVYTKSYCPYCVRAKNLLKSKGMEYFELDITQNEELQENVFNLSGGRKTVPQIFLEETSGNIKIDNKKYIHIGGFDDLDLAFKTGKL